MGYVQTNRHPRCDANVLSFGWESLGRAVQARTLDAVALHFLDVGLAELCLDALVGTLRDAPYEVEHE